MLNFQYRIKQYNQLKLYLNNFKSFIIFFSLVLLIYGSANFYIYKRIVGAATLNGGWGWMLKLLLLLVILAYPLARALQDINYVGVSLAWIGGFWLAIMVYALLACLVIDFARGVDILTGWFPDWMISDIYRTNRSILIIGATLIFIAVTWGHLSSRNPIVRTLDITLEKLPPEKNNYKIAMISDVHLGVLVGNNRIAQIVGKTNSLKPDVILVVGDLVDEPPRRLTWAIEHLRRLSATDGVYGVLGNHEYYDGLSASVEFYKHAGIELLRDTVITIPGVMNIAGWDDITGSRQFRQPSIPANELLVKSDTTLPTILMHHTPLRYKEAAAASVNLMVSGHTHGGQLWPFDYITQMVYKIHHGYSQIDSMYFYLSTGVGTWGPPVRIGSKPEIALFKLKTAFN